MSLLSDAALKEVLRKEGGSTRRCQRILALRIGMTSGEEHGYFVDKEELRVACREFRVYDAATFSYYMADLRPIHRTRSLALSHPWFVEIRERGPKPKKKIVGWKLTKEAVRNAGALLP